MLFQHLGFVHCPIREHCPAFPNCMDALIERILASKTHRPSSWNRNNQWLLSSDNNQLNLVILGVNGLADELAAKIRVSFFFMSDSNSWLFVLTIFRHNVRTTSTKLTANCTV